MNVDRTRRINACGSHAARRIRDGINAVEQTTSGLNYVGVGCFTKYGSPLGRYSHTDDAYDRLQQYSDTSSTLYEYMERSRYLRNTITSISQRTRVNQPTQTNSTMPMTTDNVEDHFNIMVKP